MEFTTFHHTGMLSHTRANGACRRFRQTKPAASQHCNNNLSFPKLDRELNTSPGTYNLHLRWSWKHCADFDSMWCFCSLLTANFNYCDSHGLHQMDNSFHRNVLDCLHVCFALVAFIRSFPLSTNRNFLLNYRRKCSLCRSTLHSPFRSFSMKTSLNLVLMISFSPLYWFCQTLCKYPVETRWLNGKRNDNFPWK